MRERLTAFFDLTITNFRSGSPPRGCPTTRGLMELGAAEGEGLDENARQAFAGLMGRITELLRDTRPKVRSAASSRETPRSRRYLSPP